MNTRQIAHIAKVSPATVSRALRNSPLVTDKTKNHILKLARELNYYPEKNRPGIKSRKTKTFGFLVSREEKGKLIYRDTNFYSGVFAGFKEEIDKYEYRILTISYRNNKLLEAIKLINMKEVDALAIIHTTESDDNFIAKHKDLFPVPFVVINREFPEDTEISYVCADEVTGGYMAGSYLYRLDHRQICCLALWQDLIYLKKRVKGYEKFVEETQNKIKQSSIIKCSHPSESYEVMKGFLENRKEITSIFLTDEELVPGVLRALRYIGKKVPDDISVMTYNDYVYSLSSEPQLTTIRLPSKEIGKLAGQILHNFVEINERQIYRVVLKPRLIERRSCRKI